MLWEVDILPAEGQPDVAARQLVHEAEELGIARQLQARSARGFLVQGDLTESQMRRAAEELLADQVVERYRLFAPGREPPAPSSALPLVVHVCPKPGVMDPAAESTLRALADRGIAAKAVRTLRKFWLSELAADERTRLAEKLLANDAIEHVLWGPLQSAELELGGGYALAIRTIPLRGLDDAQLLGVSRQGQLSLSLDEMRTIQAHYDALDRDPTDIELETIAQTWSEHCSHKTLKGRVSYRGPEGPREFDNLLKETVFAATEAIRRRAGSDDFCVSVFRDNAGVVRFDERQHAVFKVETHNHPSAI